MSQKIKFVRWLGAFGAGTSLEEAAAWELSQLDRQVAVEPLWRGRSFLNHCKIGLAVDHQASVFVKAWTTDAYTELRGTTLRPRHPDGYNRQDRGFRSLNRFLGFWSSLRPNYHGEAIFDAVHYTAVVVKRSATERGMSRANKLTELTGLPLVVL